MKLLVACLREEVKDSRSLRCEFERENIRIFNLQADKRYAYLFFVKFARVLRAERPDILHTHLPRADFAGALAKHFNPGLTWISSVHAIYSEDWSGRWSLPLFNLLWRRADALLCISHAVRDWLISRGIPQDKASMVHYGIESAKFSEPKGNLPEHWRGGDRILVGSIGRWSRARTMTA